MEIQWTIAGHVPGPVPARREILPNKDKNIALIGVEVIGKCLICGFCTGHSLPLSVIVPITVLSIRVPSCAGYPVDMRVDVGHDVVSGRRCRHRMPCSHWQIHHA